MGPEGGHPGERGGAPAAKAGAGWSWGRRGEQPRRAASAGVGRAGGRRGSAAFRAHGFWERFKPGSSQVEGTVRAQESRHQKRAALRVVPGAERRV